MSRLTYRGITYQKATITSEEKEALKRVTGTPHTYRGAVYHYEPAEKEKVV